MNGKTQNLVGWMLLLVGLAVISWAVYSSYNIFTNRTAAPEIFKIKIEVQVQSGAGKTPSTQAELQKQMENLVAEQLKGLFPVETIPKLLNLICWSIFAGILILAGAQTSGLGIKMLKK